MRAVTLVLCLAARALAQTPDHPAYRDLDLTPEARAADLVSHMTLDEKVLQMQNSAPALPRLGIPAYDWWNEALHGVARAGEATVFPQAIGLAATFDPDLMYRIADVISTEARAKYNDALRKENHARYFGLTFWSPNINIFRDPRWGRGQETYGEDPWLTSRMAVAFIRGLQGTDPHYFKVIATAKHFAVHSGPETTRHEFDVHPTDRDLNETYLPAFRAAITEGHAYSVMCAYNRVDGVPACANTDLLQKHLYDDWNFRGYVVSDCGAIHDIFAGHKYKPNAAEASAVAVKAGTDLTCGNEYRALPDAVKQGLITEADINRSLERLFTARFKLGMFDPPARVPFSTIPITENDSDAHRKVALEAARKSIVLLKNDAGVLPLANSVHSIAVIGPSADDPVALLGNYNGFSSKHVTPLEGIEKQFGPKVKVHYAVGAPYAAQQAVMLPANVFPQGVNAEYFDNPDFNGAPKTSRREPRPYLTPIGNPQGYSIRWTGSLTPTAAGEYTLNPGPGRSGVRVFFADQEVTAPLKTTLEASRAYPLRVEYRPQPGPFNGVQITWLPPVDPLIAEAVEAVKSADVTIAFVGLNPNLEGEEMRVTIPGFAGGDRTDLNLPEAQDKLLHAAFATGKRVIVVLSSGSALAVNESAEKAAALLQLWYGGEETGTAIAETLAGANNPAGRLPVTFYKSVTQLPSFDDYSMTNRTYRYFSGQGLYGFGFGLSYSKFEYSALKAQRNPRGALVSVKVKNTSAREGDEVVQLYVDGAGTPQDAIRQLKGFQRIHLRPGEIRDVAFTLAPADVPPPGRGISVGGGQPGDKTSTVKGSL